MQNLDYPFKIKQQKVPVISVYTRAAEKGRPIEIGKSSLTQNSSISDAIRIWNLTPVNVTEADSLYLAKKHKKLCQITANLTKERRLKGKK